MVLRKDTRLLLLLKAAQPTVRTAEDESFRMDENGVNVAEQQLELVRNAYQIQHVASGSVGSYLSLKSESSSMIPATFTPAVRL